jgi:hypothetical protein
VPQIYADENLPRRHGDTEKGKNLTAEQHGCTRIKKIAKIGINTFETQRERRTRRKNFGLQICVDENLSWRYEEEFLAADLC